MVETPFMQEMVEAGPTRLKCKLVRFGLVVNPD